MEKKSLGDMIRKKAEEKKEQEIKKINLGGRPESRGNIRRKNSRSMTKLSSGKISNSPSRRGSSKRAFSRGRSKNASKKSSRNSSRSNSLRNSPRGDYNSRFHLVVVHLKAAAFAVDHNGLCAYVVDDGRCGGVCVCRENNLVAGYHAENSEGKLSAGGL